jgi:hypothetical protein
MKTSYNKPPWLIISCALALLAMTSPPLARSQWPFLPPPLPPAQTPDAQRAALSVVRTQAGWVDNATRTAPNYGAAQGYGNLWQQFQTLRGSYGDFKLTLTQYQLDAGANSLAELDAGLDIIQEAFANYENDMAGGRGATSALRDLCRVMREGTALWMQEFNKTCVNLRVGRM